MIVLKLTCHACPEQYDAYVEGEEKPVAYLRLRHGYFRVEVPYDDGETIYEATPKGDGCFDADERDYHLRFAVDAIERALRGEWRVAPPPPNVMFRVEGDADEIWKEWDDGGTEEKQ